MAQALKIACFMTSLIAGLSIALLCDGSIHEPFRVVAVTGQSTPEFADSTFSSLYAPVINEKGQTAFAGTATGPDGVRRLGIWSEGSSALDVVALHELYPSGIPYTNLLQATFAFNRRGETAFFNDGIWLHSNGSTEQVAGPGVTVDVAGEATVFTQTSRPVINRNGDIAFVANQDRWSPGGASAYVRSNGQTHVLFEGAEVHFGAGPSTPLVINAFGQVASASTAHVWTNVRGTFEAVPSAALPPVSGSDLDIVTLPIVASTGKLAFAGILRNDTGQYVESIWTFGQHGLKLLTREGDQAPGLPNGVTFEPLYWFSTRDRIVSDDHGNLAFRGLVRGDGISRDNHQVIWREIDEQLDLYVQSGSQAPDLETGLLFNEFESPVLNGRGQIAFKAQLRGTNVFGTNDCGIWAEDRQGVLRLVVREGEVVDVDPGPNTDLRMITHISLPSTLFFHPRLSVLSPAWRE